MGNTINFPPGFGWRDTISAGSVGMVLDLDAVLKIPIRQKDQHFIDVEKQVYERLANASERVLHYYGPFYNGLLIQRALNGSIRQFYEGEGVQPLELQMRWAEQIVESIVFLHDNGILHADISCNNIFLDGQLNVKMGDFAGSSIDGSESLVAYSTSHEHPNLTDLTVKSEIFALGSVLYEIVTGAPPYDGLSHDQIEEAYRNEQYPNLIPLNIFRDIIARCWHREYVSANELLLDIKAQVSEVEKRKASRVSTLLDILRLRIKMSSLTQRLSIFLLCVPTLSFIVRRWWICRGR